MVTRRCCTCSVILVLRLVYVRAIIPPTCASVRTCNNGDLPPQYYKQLTHVPSVRSVETLGKCYMYLMWFLDCDTAIVAFSLCNCMVVCLFHDCFRTTGSVSGSVLGQCFKTVSGQYFRTVPGSVSGQCFRRVFQDNVSAVSGPPYIHVCS